MGVCCVVLKAVSEAAVSAECGRESEAFLRARGSTGARERGDGTMRY